VKPRHEVVVHLARVQRAVVTVVVTGGTAAEAQSAAATRALQHVAGGTEPTTDGPWRVGDVDVRTG
jgi:hypothetical protein